MSEHRLMSVRSELVRVTMVETIRARTLARVGEPLPVPVADVLDSARRPDLARAGYFTRVVETELFAPAREPSAWIAQRLRSIAEPDALRRLAEAGSPWPPVVRELAAGLAEREPTERPDPENADAVTWRIPGPGGHVRHYVALELIGDGGDPALKREVVHGLVVRCLEEAIANPALYVSRSAG